MTFWKRAEDREGKAALFNSRGSKTASGVQKLRDKRGKNTSENEAVCSF